MIRALVLWLLLALPGAAQSLPDWQYNSINDFAGLLTNDDTRIIDQSLIALFDATDIEGTVVTLPDRARYGGNDGLEGFATRLFNHWGIGDARRNDGFMILILRDDREARIELGAGYPAAFDRVAQAIMDDVMLPHFRAGDASTGLREGTLAVIDRIARPHAAGEPPQLGDDQPPFSIMALFLGLPLLMFGTVRGGIWWVRGRCPQCRRRDLITSIAPLREETGDGGWKISKNRVERICQHCGWRGETLRGAGTTRIYAADGALLQTIRHRRSGGRSGGGGGFGGGSSSGGGASGRW